MPDHGASPLGRVGSSDEHSGTPPETAFLYRSAAVGLIFGTVNSLGTATVTVTAVSGIGSSGFHHLHLDCATRGLPDLLNPPR